MTLEEFKLQMSSFAKVKEAVEQLEIALKEEFMKCFKPSYNEDDYFVDSTDTFRDGEIESVYINEIDIDKEGNKIYCCDINWYDQNSDMDIYTDTRNVEESKLTHIIKMYSLEKA